jgi:long-chain acyl-CoA synthetase
MLPKWEVEYALQVCIDEKVTFVGAMATMLNDILASEMFWKNRDKFSFTNIGTGGSATPSKLILRAASALPKLTQGSGWGLTETNSVGTIIGGPDYLEFPESCGRPHPIVDLKLIDPETGEDIHGRNIPGELCIRSVTNMVGYWNNPEETKKVLLPGNWIKSGDLGTIDEEGFVRIIDRVKDIVIRGGENISTSEVEGVLYAFTGGDKEGGEVESMILEASTFGLPHERLGEQLVAVVVPYPNKTINTDALRQYCEKKLAKFKVPAHFFIRNSPLPRGGTGKILKRKLKEEYKNKV